MTTEEKQLLLKDLCARLPYGVKFQGEDSNVYTLDAANYFALQVEDVVFKPYLRPMSSMTEEEFIHYGATREWRYVDNDHYEYFATLDTFDWLLEHHFDYRGLIEKSLALVAPDNMYK